MSVLPAVGELSGSEDSNSCRQRDRDASLIDIYVWIKNETRGEEGMSLGCGRGERTVATAFADVNTVLLGQVFAV